MAEITQKTARKEGLLKKIDALKDKFANPAYLDDVAVIKDWEETVKRSMIQDSLVEHEGIQFIVQKIKDEIEEIEVVLLNKIGLEQHERDIILVKKQMFEWFLKHLTPGDEVETVEKSVDEALASVEE
jgi:hypothetical protein